MNTTITGGFWHARLEVNARRAIFHQWEQLEASGCIENFRIAAGDAGGFREGWFFADSDAHKWLDAASRIYASSLDARLGSLMDGFIALLARAQEPDGYLFTYNQIHFPGTRWANLQIEHELYCHGHLIEAGVSHHEATGRTELLELARRAADRIVEDFKGKGPKYTPGHEEIEIALLRLYQTTRQAPYLDLARQFIEQRGRTPLFALSILKQNFSAEKRSKFVQRKKQEYLATHPEFKPFQLPPENASKKHWNTTLRWYASAMSGKYFQQHQPVRQQTVPVGHSVRFGYLETAIAMLDRLSQPASSETRDDHARVVSTLERAWEHMVTRRMYVTGGIGSLAGLEGFGNDYELDPEYAYAETCAALASMFWNWEMSQLTDNPKYGDLFEWQLYNAAAVGMGLEGSTYLYNNPLTCHGGVTRKPWYAVPCCPSNISRTWADLGKYIHSETEDGVVIHQYISSQFATRPAQIRIHSNLPWDGKVEIQVFPENPPHEFTLHVRLPSWSVRPQVKVTGNDVDVTSILPDYDKTATASGYDPRLSRSLPITRVWNSGDEISCIFDMPLMLRTALPNVKGHHGKFALTRGPLVYCLESTDNSEVDIFEAIVSPPFAESYDPDLLGGIVKVIASTTDAKNITFVPYYVWGNRGESQMTIWVNA